MSKRSIERSEESVLTPRKILRNLEESDTSDEEFEDDSDVDPTYTIEQDDVTVFDESEAEDNNNEINEIMTNMRIAEEREDEMEEEEFDDNEVIWSVFSNRQQNFPFTGPSGMLVTIPDTITPLEAFKMFVTDDIIQMIVKETNRYAEHNAAERSAESAKKPVKPTSRIKNWKRTSEEEIRSFLGILIYMGICPRTRLSEYWSNSILFANCIAQKVISINRFQLLLSMFHFSDNTQIPEGDKLGKIRPLIDALLKNFQELYCPEKDVVIDETLIPWRGRLKFRQYIPNKAHKYGIKLFKLCSTDGYTYNFSVYVGKKDSGVREVGLSQNVCQELMENLLGQGRTLFVDNFYTSYDLAKILLVKKTHLVGTVRRGRRHMPKEVFDAKLKRGEMIAREDQRGIVVLKWKDTRDVRLLSTLHKPEMQQVMSTRKRTRTEAAITQENPDDSVAAASTSLPAPRVRWRTGSPIRKPEAVISYNKGKAGIDLSDQMSSYSSSLRKGLKWFRKLGIELLLGMAVVNAHYIYKKITKKSIPIRLFRISIAEDLLRPSVKNIQHVQTHILKSTNNEKGKEVWRSCKNCYRKLVSEKGTLFAQKKNPKSKYFCSNCSDDKGNHPYMCVECFGELHSAP